MADLEAAIRRLEESLAEARQDLLDFDGENYLSVDKKIGRWLFISGPDISSPQKPKGEAIQKP